MTTLFPALWRRVLRDTTRAAETTPPDHADFTAGFLARLAVEPRTRWAVHPDDLTWLQTRYERDPDGTEQFLRDCQADHEAGVRDRADVDFADEVTSWRRAVDERRVPWPGRATIVIHADDAELARHVVDLGWTPLHDGRAWTADLHTPEQADEYRHLLTISGVSVTQ